MRTRPLVLILVEAPFQLMCAIEFMKERNENDYELVFIETNSKENTKHFLQLIDLFQIGTSVENVVSFEIIPRRNNFLFIVVLNLVLSKASTTHFFYLSICYNITNLRGNMTIR